MIANDKNSQIPVQWMSMMRNNAPLATYSYTVALSWPPWAYVLILSRVAQCSEICQAWNFESFARTHGYENNRQILYNIYIRANNDHVYRSYYIKLKTDFCNLQLPFMDYKEDWNMDIPQSNALRNGSHFYVRAPKNIRKRILYKFWTSPLVPKNNEKYLMWYYTLGFQIVHLLERCSSCREKWQWVPFVAQVTTSRKRVMRGLPNIQQEKS